MTRRDDPLAYGAAQRRRDDARARVNELAAKAAAEACRDDDEDTEVDA